MMTIRTRMAAAILALCAAGPALSDEAAPPPPSHDMLNAVLWMQRSVEYRANSEGAFALARIRLDQALADKTWTGAPEEQTGAYQALPPAIILDLDETVLDNSKYQAWLVAADKTFSQTTWTSFVQDQDTTAIPGSVAFAQYADSRGVKVFYVSNRLYEGEEEATRGLMAKLGFPGGGNTDTYLTVKKKPDWGSTKGTRRAYVAKDYRILLNLGDNLSDFVDDYKGNESARLGVMMHNQARWGREWIMLANPAYGSFEGATFGFDYKTSQAEQRKAKRDALTPWPGPKN